jgi:hypothetical protein
MTATIAAIDKAMAHPKHVARPARGEGGEGGTGGGGGVLNGPRMPRIEGQRNVKSSLSSETPGRFVGQSSALCLEFESHDLWRSLACRT